MIASLSQSTLTRVNRLKFAALVLLIVGSFVILLTVENLLVSCLLAFVISYTVGPLVNFIERQGISRMVATVFTFAAIGALLLGLGFWLFPYVGESVSGLQNDMPR